MRAKKYNGEKGAVEKLLSHGALARGLAVLKFSYIYIYMCACAMADEKGRRWRVYFDTAEIYTYIQSLYTCNLAIEIDRDRSSCKIGRSVRTGIMNVDMYVILYISRSLILREIKRVDFTREKKRDSPPCGSAEWRSQVFYCVGGGAVVVAAARARAEFNGAGCRFL